jgi:hypothetical protein
MNWLQQLLRGLVGNQMQTGANPSMFEELKKTRPKGQADPNLAMILASQNGMRNQRDTQGNYIMPGEKSFFQGASGLDAYKEMNRNNQGSSLPGFGNNGLTSTEVVQNKISKLRGQNPNEDLTSLLRRLK